LIHRSSRIRRFRNTRDNRYIRDSHSIPDSRYSQANRNIRGSRLIRDNHNIPDSRGNPRIPGNRFIRNLCSRDSRSIRVNRFIRVNPCSRASRSIRVNQLIQGSHNIQGNRFTRVSRDSRNIRVNRSCLVNRTPIPK
jgi:hypothetical protein